MQIRNTTISTYTVLWATLLLIASTATSASADGAGRRSGNLLIIAASDYVDSVPLNHYETIKAAQGFNVMTYSVPSGTSRTAIKSYIQGLWGTEDAPDYILLVGDTNGSTSTAATIPHWSGGGSKGSDTDLPYACMDSGDDWYPDIYIGRWSVRNVATLQDVVDKSLFVEAGNFSDPDYAKRGAFLANPSTYGTAEPSHDFVIENYLEPAGYTGIKIYASQGGGTQDVTEAVNAGVMWTVYFGHSGSSGWWDPQFYQSNVNSLSNAGLYGVACGWSCNTAHYSYDECFGETWLRAANKGAAAYISASDYIYWGSVDAWMPSVWLERSFFRAFFEDQVWEVGAAWQVGLYHFLTDYGEWDGNHSHPPTANQDICRNFFEEFVVLGDPTLLLPGGKTFEVYSDPEMVSLCSPPEDTAVYTIDVVPTGAFDEVVALSSIGQPAGSTVEFSVNNQVPPFTSEMTISGVTTGSPGSYTIKVSGNSATVEQSYFVQLYLSDEAPAQPVPTSPPNGSEDNPVYPILNWAPVSQAVEYEIEIATDIDFNNIVYTATASEITHVVETELERATQYFWHVRASNACGIGDFSPTFTFMTYIDADYFTEQFTGDFDLEYLTVHFIPDGTGDYYMYCGEAATELPTDPSGGTTIHLPDDGFGHLELASEKTIPFYGTEHTSYYVGANGYITFSNGDDDSTESLGDHFDLPRISALFDDLTPEGGTVRCRQYSNRVVVTFEDVPEHGTSNSNTFQIEMFFDGEITITWLNIDSTDALVGLSAGEGIPADFDATDLSDLEPCVTDSPPQANSDSLSTQMNVPFTIDLVATDDGLPEPPALTYIITWLPSHGSLSDPGAGMIDSVPYTLAAGGNQVEYTPEAWYIGPDSFAFKANDGGEPPTGGDSNIAVISIDVVAPDPEVVYAFPLDSDPGWTCEGAWAFGQPTGGGSHYGDPDSGFTGSNVYGYNLEGDYSNSMPEMRLTSTAIDCSYLQDAELSFQRWLGVERSTYDHAAVEISADGANWTVLWENSTTTISESSWSEVSYDISTIADGESTVYLRWVMGTTDTSTTYPGWNIDDIEITAIVMGSQQCLGDLNGDGTVDLSDLSQLLAHYGMTSGASYDDGDIDEDGDVDLSDLSALLAVYGTVCP